MKRKKKRRKSVTRYTRIQMFGEHFYGQNAALVLCIQSNKYFLSICLVFFSFHLLRSSSCFAVVRFTYYDCICTLYIILSACMCLCVWLVSIPFIWSCMRWSEREKSRGISGYMQHTQNQRIHHHICRFKKHCNAGIHLKMHRLPRRRKNDMKWAKEEKGSTCITLKHKWQPQ